MLYEKNAQGLATACSKRKKPKTMSEADKPKKCVEHWCTGLVTVQPMYANALREDALPKPAEVTVPRTTVDIQTQQTLSRTPANVSGMQIQTLQLTSGVVACCR